MNPSFRCPSCHSRFRAEEKFLGRRVRCPNPECGKPVVLTLEPVPPTPKVVDTVSAPESSFSKPSVATSKSKGTDRLKPERVQAESRAESASLKNQVPAASPRTGNRRTTRSPQVAGQSRYQSQNSMMPVVVGFMATLVLGGVAIGGYLYWSNTVTTSLAQAAGSHSNATTGAQTDLTSAIATENNSASPETPANAASHSASSLGGAQLTSAASGAALRQAAERQRKLEEKILPFLAKHCSDCHNADEQEGGIAVHDLKSVDQLLKDRKKWEKVYRMINAGAMPPSSYDPQPEEGDRKVVIDAFYDELYDFDCTQVHHAGRSTLHRLNRAEYNNTIRDLFGISLTPADKFPQDDVGEGFDNIGDVLSLPPLLMEKYLDAAEEVATAVIDTRDFSRGTTQQFAPDKFKSTIDGNVDGEGFYVLHTNGTLTVPFDAVADGKYKVRIEAAQSKAGPDDSNMALLIDGQAVHEFKVGENRKPGWFEHDVTLTAGSHSVAAAFTNDFYDEKAPERRRDRNLAVRIIEVTGPEGGGAPQWHDTHRRFVTTVPSETVSVKDAATAVLRPILYRGFRRPVTDAEVDRFASLVQQVVTEHKESYEFGLSIALQAMLVSPDFLFRKEADPEGDAKERSLGEYEIASRLSYFLWSSMPDDQLFQLAENKRLLDRTVLRGQIERMLRDEKAISLAQNFASQWLNLRNLADIRPNPELFPEFDEALRSAMSQETSLLFSTIVREDRSIDEFLSADYTFVNERLANHYGISGVSGDQFVRVSLEGTNRSGVMTHASVLALTSNPGRTSPVKRGKWILENILGDAPPPAPPGVPALEETAKDVTTLSLRERMELHRKDPGCASCHKTMDPLGMGLENFDAVGRWRDKEGERPVDASGDLPTGERFVGPIELAGILQSRQEKFARTFTERLMVYGLGRGLEYYDKCAVDQTVDLMKQRGNRFSALVEGIVMSDPFLKKSRTRESEVTVNR